MLVLSRYEEEAVHVRLTPAALQELAAEAADTGQPLDIRVMVSRIQGNKVRLGFAGDARIDFVREEILSPQTKYA